MIPSEPSPQARYLSGAATLAVRAQPDQPWLPYAAAKVRVDEVASELGLSRTALYRRWETQHDFWKDLSRFLVLRDDYARTDDAMPWHADPEPMIAAGAVLDLTEILRVTVNDLQGRLYGDSLILVRASMLAYADLPEIAAARRPAELDRIGDLAGLLQALVDGVGCRFSEPLDSFGVATALWCLADGLTVRAWRQAHLGRTTIAIDDGEGPKPWTLLAYATRALMMEAIEPGRRPAGAPHGTAGPAGISSGTRTSQPQWTPAQLEALEVARDLFLSRVDPAQSSDPDHEISALGQVTMASVARECRVSRRSVHNIWPSSDELRLDLLTTLLHAERRTVAKRLDTVVSRHPAPELRSSQLAASLVRQATPGQLWVGHPRLAYLVDSRHPGVRSRNAVGTAEILDVFERYIAKLYPAEQRPSSATLDDRHLATLVSCLSDGANRLARVLPEAVVGPKAAMALGAAIDAWVRHDPGSPRLHA